MSKRKEPGESFLEEVRRIVLDGLRGLRAKVYLFGSWAEGGNWDASDIDVAVLPEEPLPPGTLSRVREALEESHVPYSVDLVDISEAKLSFRKRVEEKGILWSD